MILAGDIGGTKTILAVFSAEQGLRAPLSEKTFPSQQYNSLEDIVQEFLAEFDTPIEAACFGVAGPVVEGQARITNLPWIIDTNRLRDVLGIDNVRLLNDLESVACAIPALTTSDLYVLNTGETVTKGAIGVIAPGTGLGEAFLTWDGQTYRAYPSEGGHATFAPRSEVERDMLRYLWQTYEHVSYERVCSGMGIPNIYQYFRDTLDTDELPEVVEKLEQAQDKTPVIVNAALDEEHPSEICRRTLEQFVSILGAEAGNLALKVLATGGVYIGGGIAPRIHSVLDDERFMHTFRHKGRFASMLDRIPVYVIRNSKTALLGAARFGLLMAGHSEIDEQN